GVSSPFSAQANFGADGGLPGQRRLPRPARKRGRLGTLWVIPLTRGEACGRISRTGSDQSTRPGARRVEVSAVLLPGAALGRGIAQALARRKHLKLRGIVSMMSCKQLLRFSYAVALVATAVLLTPPGGSPGQTGARRAAPTRPRMPSNPGPGKPNITQFA